MEAEAGWKASSGMMRVCAEAGIWHAGAGGSRSSARVEQPMPS